MTYRFQMLICILITILCILHLGLALVSLQCITYPTPHTDWGQSVSIPHCSMQPPLLCPCQCHSLLLCLCQRDHKAGSNATLTLLAQIDIVLKGIFLLDNPSSIPQDNLWKHCNALNKLLNSSYIYLAWIYKLTSLHWIVLTAVLTALIRSWKVSQGFSVAWG